MILTLEWTSEGVRFIDQTKLPLEETYVLATSYQQVADIIVTMVVSSNVTIMGEYVNGRAAKILGWLTATLMAVAAIALFATGGV